MLTHSRALYQDRLCQGAPSGDHRRPLEHLLPRPKERYRQNAWMHRFAQTELVHLVEHFKMEGLHTIRQLIRRNDLITKVDLSDFYMHFWIGWADGRYMRFMWEGKKYQCIGMPFGLAPARPRLATKMMALVIRYLRSRGLRLAIYIDDLILLS